MSTLTRTQTTLKRRRHGYTHTELESVEVSFSTRDGETKLFLVIEQSTRETFDEGGPNEEVVKNDSPPRLSIRPSHGWGGLTREESMFVAELIPRLWEEWDRLMLADEPGKVSR